MAEQRPATFTDFVGQVSVVRQIKLALESAKVRGDIIDHVLLAGPPGLGKTTIANIVATTLGTRCIETIATVLKSPADVISSLVSLRRGDVLFIDEIHSLPPVVQEYLYTAMEDYKISTLAGGGAKRAITIHLNKFVLVGATTNEGGLTGPLLDRFGIICNLFPYDEKDIKEIVSRAAVKHNLKVTNQALDIIANRSRATPRIALRHLRRIRDSAVSMGRSREIDGHAALHAYAVLGIARHGLTGQDLAVLRVLAHHTSATGVAALASETNIQQLTIEAVIEPHLLRIKAVMRTPRGRVITEFGRSLLK